MKETITPVLLLTGYLGSGKTTLLNRILANRRGIRFAVIVNDIGEVNIDADLIKKEAIVGQDDSGDLVALQNGCICCSLKADLMKQLDDLLSSGEFDYIVIEASGVCEPAPIAQTICAMEAATAPIPKPRLDCIATVVDALRLRDEFASGEALQNDNIEEHDIESLIIEQIEFCNIVILNKISEVSDIDREKIKAVIRALQPQARILECDYCDINLDEILNTHLFDFEKVATSATWVQAIEAPVEPEDKPHHEHHDHHHHEDEHHDHPHDHNHEDHSYCDHEHGHCCHHHEHGHDHVAEFGISTFVYFRRRPFDFHKFDRFVNLHWPKSIIRSKGVIWFSHNPDMSLLFESAGHSFSLREAGMWYATAPEEELRQMMAQDPSIARDWDPEVGDRMIKLVIIGRDMDKEEIIRNLDACLA